MAVLEAGLKVKADVKLPLQRRRAAAKIAVKHGGFFFFFFCLFLAPGSAGAEEAGKVFRHKPPVLPWAEPPRSSACQVLPPLPQRTRVYSVFVSANANEFFWLILVSTEEEKLVLEKSVRHSSKVRVFFKK